ncbi:MAG: YfiR family protein [Pseudomonadota bacterium]
MTVIAFPYWLELQRRLGGVASRSLARQLLSWTMALLLASACASAAAEVASASATAASEDRLEAAFLYKFLNYVEWPASAFAKADAPYVIGIVDADDVADELHKIANGRNVNNRPVLVKKLAKTDTPEGVHVLFIAREAHLRQPQLFKQARQEPILVVTETDDALKQGSMINFKIVDERLRFDVALEPVEKSGLKLSSRLLTVASSTIKAPPP